MIRFALITVAVMTIVWWTLPPERKATWRDRRREFISALAVGMLVYWVFIVARWAWINL